MLRLLSSLALVLGLLPLRPAAAEVPDVVTDIAPVHALAARVMAGIATPDLLLPPGASPHGYAMRPSDAAALERADAVFWVSHELTPWLQKPLDTLAGTAQIVELLEIEDATRLPVRTDTRFGAHDHGHDHGHDPDQGHEGDGQATDPHGWLDPENGKVWLDAMASVLAQLDPANAETYRANAAAGKAEIDALMSEIATRLAPVARARFVVFHDAFQYFEQRFGLSAAGAIAAGDAASPGPARVAGIRDLLGGSEIRCVFSEPQFRSGLVDTAVEGTGARIATIDPMGAGQPLGPALYPALLDGLSRRLAECLGGGE